MAGVVSSGLQFADNSRGCALNILSQVISRRYDNKSYLDLAIVKIVKYLLAHLIYVPTTLCKEWASERLKLVTIVLFYFVREFHSFGSIVLKFRDSSILLFAFGT